MYQKATSGWNETNIVESFVPDEALRERCADLLVPQFAAAEGTSDYRFLLTNQTTRYAVTVGAMVLAVIAFGMLLNHRPQGSSAWTETDRQGDGFRMVPQHVGLIVLFASLDLVCTLIAGHSVGFWELNPVAGSLVDAPVAMIAFKSVATAGSATILLSLRKYRGAQVASWWLCFVCTILLFRWVTVNSLFLA